MKMKMKTKLLFIAFALVNIFSINAQVNVSGDIASNTTWTNNNIYTLTGGFVYVTNNATLTIEPGTIIKGTGAALVITRGAKLMAQGTQTQPIVFTSSQPAGSRAAGDWGGILLLGKAPINDPAGQRLGEGGIDPVKGLYGGTDANDNSGVLTYVRIEYAGIAFQPNNETNSLTMGGVGAGTTIDYVQVSYGGDDGFEWFGGTVNCKHLIVNKTVDDMFDTDWGFTGRVQFAVGVSDSLIADISGSNGFESDNDATGTTNGPLTKPIFTNISLFGPRATATSSGYNVNFTRAAHLRRSSALCTYNSVLVGFPTGLKIDGTTTGQGATNGSLQFKSNIVAGYLTTPTNRSLDSTGLTTPVFTMNSWFNANGNTAYPNPLSVMAIAPTNYFAPNFLLQAGSPALSGANFTYPNLNNAFFTTTTYKGAFDGSNDWTACWSNFNPQTTDYNTPGISYLAVSATAGGPVTFCQGGSVVLTSSASSNNTWSNAATTQGITVSTSGTYTVTTTNAAGCVATSSPIVVLVNALPTTPTITAGTTTFCQGGSVVLTSSASSNNTWSGGETTQGITATSTGNYTVTVNDVNGCQATSTATVVTVNALPSTPTISASGPTSFCTGSSVTLTSSAANGNTWSSSETTAAINVTASGVFSVTYTDGNGCQATSAATTVDVSATPVPTISSTATQACSGETITLTASTSDTYLWSNGTTSQTVDATANGTYYVTTTNANLCDGVGQSAAVTLTFTQTPTASATNSTSGNVVTFTNTSTNATSYSWDFGDQSNSSATSPSHAFAANGSYTVTLTATNGNCTDVITYTLVISVGLNEVENFADVKLYPNPTSANTTLEFENQSANEATVTIINQLGQIITVQNVQLEQGNNSIELNTIELNNGLYTVVLQTENNSVNRRLIIQK
jgi:PKD repeat protein